MAAGRSPRRSTVIPTAAGRFYPKLGAAHAAIFEPEQAFGSAGSTALTFRLTQGQRQHAVGQLRLSVSGEASPVLPAAYANAGTVVQAQLPASRTGGILLLTGGKETAIVNASLRGGRCNSPGLVGQCHVALSVAGLANRDRIGQRSARAAGHDSIPTISQSPAGSILPPR